MAWRDLYETAVHARDLAAWDWMDETQMFGLRIPGEPHTWYCSIMGVAGEHRSYCFYRGEEALRIYLKLENASGDELDEYSIQDSAILFYDCIQVSFEDRHLIHERELAIIKKLGIKFRGRNQWVSLKDYSPGWLPWAINEDQVPVTHTLLLKAMDVAMDCKAGKINIDEWITEGEQMPVFTLENDAWKLEYKPVMLPLDEDIDLRPATAPQGWESLRFLPQSHEQLVCGTFTTMEPAQSTPSSRPSFGKFTMLVNFNNERILGLSVIDPEQYELYEERLINLFRAAKARPRTIYFADEQSEVLLTDCFSRAGIPTAWDEEAVEVMQGVAASFFSFRDQNNPN